MPFFFACRSRNFSLCQGFGDGIKLFHQSIRKEKISDIVDIGYSFVIWSKMNGYDDYPETFATAINKTTGKISAYFEPDHWDELDEAIEIIIPENYRSFRGRFNYTKKVF